MLVVAALMSNRGGNFTSKRNPNYLSESLPASLPGLEWPEGKLPAIKTLFDFYIFIFLSYSYRVIKNGKESCAFSALTDQRKNVTLIFLSSSH